MQTNMRGLLTIMLFVLGVLLAGTSKATADYQLKNGDDILYWTGVRCETEDQLEQFRQLRKKVRKVILAISQGKLDLPQGCEVGGIWFSKIREIERIQGEWQIYRTIAVKLLFIKTPEGARRVKEPMERYILVVERIATV